MSKKYMDILLIEDNPLDAVLFNEYISASTYKNAKITNTTDISSTIETLQSCAFDIIFLDLGLPDSVGLTSLTKILSFSKNIPIVVLSGNDDQKTGEKAVSIGAQDYLVKGKIDEDILNRIIHYSITREQQRTALMEANRQLSLREQELYAANQQLAASEQQLKTNQAELKRNLESLNLGEHIAGLGYFERNWQTGKGFWSNGFYTLLDVKPDDVDCTHEDFMQYIQPDDKQRVAEHIKTTLEEHQDMDIEFRLVQSSGKILHIHGIGKNFFDKVGRPLKTIGTFQDITQRKK